MSETTKNRIIARYIILKAAGVKISASFQAVVDTIQNERNAATVAKYQGARA